MSGPNQFAVYLFASGDAFFVGAALIVFGRAATWQFRQNRRAKWLRLLTVLGVIALVLSVTPLPVWLSGLCVLLPLLSLNVPIRDDSNRSRILRCLQPFVEFVLLIGMRVECLERRQLHVQPFASLPAEIHIIGDSLSAGIANEHDQLWPSLIGREWKIPVRNHAQVGATTAAAIRQAEAVTAEDCTVLIEIGGNDFFEGRPVSQIEADWDRLLTQLGGPHRTLIMFELPLPPTPGAYDLARLQRRLAHWHAVRLIPRRDFAKVLLTPGATSDGLHLTPLGHRAMAEIVHRSLTPAR